MKKEEIKELDRWTRKKLIAGRYGGRVLISVEECYAAEFRSIDFYPANSEEELLKVVAKLEKLEKDKIESKKSATAE